MIKKTLSAIILLIGILAFSCGRQSLAAEVALQPDFTFESEAEPEDPALLRLQRGDQAMRERLYENAILNFQEYRQFVGKRQPDSSRALGKLAEAYLAGDVGYQGDLERIFDLIDFLQNRHFNTGEKYHLLKLLLL